MPYARTAALTLALVALSAGGARGQQIDSPYRYIEPRQSLGAFVGGIAVDPGDLDLGSTGGAVFGGRYTIRLTGPLSAEVTFIGGPGERTVYTISTADSVPVALPGSASTFIVAGDAGLRFHLTGQRTWNGIAPFGTLGIGVVSDLRGLSELEQAVSPLDQRFDFGPGFAARVGVGTDWFLSERLSVRLDLHDYVWRVTSPPGLSPTGRSQTSWTHNFAFTLGTAVHF